MNDKKKIPRYLIISRNRKKSTPILDHHRQRTLKQISRCPPPPLVSITWTGASVFSESRRSSSQQSRSENARRRQETPDLARAILKIKTCKKIKCAATKDKKTKNDIVKKRRNVCLPTDRPTDRPRASDISLYLNLYHRRRPQHYTYRPIG